MKTKKRVISILCTFIMLSCLVACGNSTPAIGNDVVSIEESTGTESSEAESTEVSTEIVESGSAETSKEDSTEVKAEDTEITETKPTEEPTTTPAVPTSTPSPETPTPEPATGEHNWEPIYQTVTHPSTGHVEEVQVQVGTTKRTEYECGVCGQRANTPSELADHRASFVGTDRNHATANTIAWDYEEPVYEMQSQWVVDTPETTTQELVGYKCSICGATK